MTAETLHIIARQPPGFYQTPLEMMNNPLNESLFRDESFEMQILVTQSYKKNKYINKYIIYVCKIYVPYVGGAKASGRPSSQRCGNKMPRCCRLQAARGHVPAQSASVLSEHLWFLF